MELIWDTSQKIVLSALLLAFDVVRATLSQVDLAASSFVQPISTASQTASSIEHKNDSSSPSKRHSCYHQNMVEHLKIETGPSQFRVKDLTKVMKPI